MSQIQPILDDTNYDPNKDTSDGGIPFNQSLQRFDNSSAVDTSQLYQPVATVTQQAPDTTKYQQQANTDKNVTGIISTAASTVGNAIGGWGAVIGDGVALISNIVGDVMASSATKQAASAQEQWANTVRGDTLQQQYFNNKLALTGAQMQQQQFDFGKFTWGKEYELTMTNAQRQWQLEQQKEKQSSIDSFNKI